MALAAAHSPGGPAGVVPLFGTPLHPCPLPPASPAVLYVVVDTEAEFDWSKPFAHDLVGVTAMAAQERAQVIFDRFGIRPVYVVDYPVASQQEGFAPLRAIHARGGCEIGAHLHPWTNPPFDEPVSLVNSYPGNLPAAAEEAKLTVLLEAIQASFGIAARFYKSGRFGIGPHTLAMLGRHGISVDFSVLPGADLRANSGPDFRALRPVAYGTADRRIAVVPMTRDHIGPLAGQQALLGRWLDRPAAQWLRARGILSRLHLFNKVALTPEGTTTAELLALLNSLHRRGVRQFVMSYHSPSLVPGHTPHVRSDADLAGLLERIEAVCRHVLGPLGGRAGEPLDLLPERLCPAG